MLQLSTIIESLCLAIIQCGPKVSKTFSKVHLNTCSKLLHYHQFF